MSRNIRNRGDVTEVCAHSIHRHWTRVIPAIDPNNQLVHLELMCIPMPEFPSPLETKRLRAPIPNLDPTRPVKSNFTFLLLLQNFFLVGNDRRKPKYGSCLIF